MSLFFAKLCFLQFLKLQLTLVSYCSYSLRFRFSLFYKSEISLLEICSQLGQSQILLCFNLLLPSDYTLFRIQAQTSSHCCGASLRSLFGLVSLYPTQISQKKRRTQGFVSEKQVTMYIRQKCLLNQR